MKIIFKALTGFGAEREVFFDAFDLEKVQYAALHQKRVLLSNGQFVDGKYIQQISPDWHRTMGWNQEHVLTTYDMNEVRSVGADTEAYRLLTVAKERIHFLLLQGRENEIGKNVKIPELERPKFELREGKIKSLGELLPKNHETIQDKEAGGHASE
jgi:hypothetical protein